MNRKFKVQRIQMSMKGEENRWMMGKQVAIQTEDEEEIKCCINSSEGEKVI